MDPKNKEYFYYHEKALKRKNRKMGDVIDQMEHYAKRAQQIEDTYIVEDS